MNAFRFPLMCVVLAASLPTILPAQDESTDGPPPAIQSEDGIPQSAGSGTLPDPDEPAETQLKRVIHTLDEAWLAISSDDPAFAALSTAVESYANNPEDPKAAAHYVEKMTDAIELLKHRLEDFSRHREAVMEAFRRFDAENQTSIDATIRERELLAQVQAERAERVAQAEKQLDTLALQYAAQLESGDPLPVDVERQFIQFEDAIAHAERMKRFQEMKTIAGERLLRDHEVERDRNDRSMTAYERRFRQADRDMEALQLVAEVVQTVSTTVQKSIDPGTIGQFRPAPIPDIPLPISQPRPVVRRTADASVRARMLARLKTAQAEQTTSDTSGKPAAERKVAAGN